MAGEWIRMRHDLRDDPACLTLSDILSDTIPAVVGRLYYVWSWVDRHTTDGLLRGITTQHIDRVAECEGFAAAMVAVGWLAENDDGLEIPQFTRHNGNSSKARALESEAKRLRRQEAADAPKACPTLSDKTSDQRRGEENKKKVNQKSGKAASSSFDPSKIEIQKSLDDARFRDAWQSWIQHRREKRKPLTETSVTMLMRQFEGWGIGRSIAAINHTITMGWIGIREPDGAEAATDEPDRPRGQPKRRRAVAS